MEQSRNIALLEQSAHWPLRFSNVTIHKALPVPVSRWRYRQCHKHRNNRRVKSLRANETQTCFDLHCTASTSTARRHSLNRLCCGTKSTRSLQVKFSGQSGFQSRVLTEASYASRILPRFGSAAQRSTITDGLRTNTARGCQV